MGCYRHNSRLVAFIFFHANKMIYLRQYFIRSPAVLMLCFSKYAAIPTAFNEPAINRRVSIHRPVFTKKVNKMFK
jgi:hypothetical protein